MRLLVSHEPITLRCFAFECATVFRFIRKILVFLQYLNNTVGLGLQTTPLDIFMMMLGQQRNWFWRKGLYPLLLGEQACIYAGKLFEVADLLLHVGSSHLLVGICLLHSSSQSMQS